MINKAFAYISEAAILSTTGNVGKEPNKNVGNVSPIMGALTSKDSDLSSYCDEIDENGNNNTSINQKEIDNYKIDANKGKIKVVLSLEQFW